MSVLRDHIDGIVDSLLDDTEDPADIIDMLVDSVEVAARSRGITIRQIPDDNVRWAIRRIIDYSWADEHHDYAENAQEMDDPSDHIFTSLQLLDSWLRGDGESSTCRHCQRSIIKVDGLWIDPEASGDDSVWRETCDAHDTFVADHEPAGGTE